MALTLPYYAPDTSLPCALPTLAEIESSNDILCDATGRKVVGVGSHFVIKYGLQTDLTEGQAMVYVARHTSVSVPRVYALFEDEATGKKFIIMERIQGRSLDQIWSTLTEPTKVAISAIVKSSMDRLRELPSPGGFCGVHGGPLPDALFWFYDEIGSGGHQEGPFESEGALNSSLVRQYATSPFLVGKAKFFERAFPTVFHGHAPTFCHGDLQRKNIMVNFPEDISTMRITIIDWETAGWYPSYWEYAKAMFACGRFEDDWGYWLDQILRPYLSEYAFMYILMTELWS